YPQPYEALKGLTRTSELITEKAIREFILSLAVSGRVQEELLRISPFNYTGI
ncbi:MAG: hypothetical protein ACOVLE_00230, partial [Pirellula staleyi]